MGICCMAQETQIGSLYQPRGVEWGGREEGGSKGRAYIYTYGWFMLRFGRKQQNSVKQLSFNSKINKKKNTNILTSLRICSILNKAELTNICVCILYIKSISKIKGNNLTS